jgi:hypothetical protein
MILALVALLACGRESRDSDSRPLAWLEWPVSEVAPAEPTNRTPYVPPACYARTEAGRNPCYACHHRGEPPNVLDDTALQLARTFAEPAARNPWTNLFEDRSALAASWTDDEMRAWVRTDNYRALRARDAWDQDGDGRFTGFVPDCAYDFDADGFDRDASGAPTGWRAYASTPFPGAFWPTNGSFGDSAIRLPVPYRSSARGAIDPTVYRVNLAIVRAAVSRADAPLRPPVSERAIGADLDGDGRLGHARAVRYEFAPREKRWMHFVGAAGLLQDTKEIQPRTAGLYPLGTEILHGLRYVDVDDDGGVRPAPRRKEIRYAKKTRWLSYADLELAVAEDFREDTDEPDAVRQLFGDGEHGIANGVGWRLQGYVEDTYGELRPQTTAETGYCVGCHGGVGATTDSLFSFERVLDGETTDWKIAVDWTRERIPDRVREDDRGEAATYVALTGGDDFGANPETAAKVGDPRIATDLGWLILPSAERAMALNRATRALVAEQDFTHGRDPVLAPVEAIRSLDEVSTGIVRAEPGNRVRPRVD